MHLKDCHQSTLTTSTVNDNQSTISPPILLTSRVPDAIGIRITRVDLVRLSVFHSHSEFILEVDELGGHKTTVSKRYREFAELHRLLLAKVNSSVKLPELPPKKLFGNLDLEFIETRRSLLDDYLKELLRHPIVPTLDSFWHFIDADDATNSIAQFLCGLPTEQIMCDRLDSLWRLFSEESNLFRLSHTLVIERLIQILQCSSIPTVLRVCFLLTQLIIRTSLSYETLVRNCALSALLTQFESYIHHEPLAAACLQVALTLVCYYPNAFLFYLRSPLGFGQLLRLVNNSVLPTYHSSLGLLIWFSIDIDDVQLALAEPDSRGMDVLGALYRSSNSNARFICGMLISYLIINERFLSEEMMQVAAAGLDSLPGELQDVSCRAGRLSLFHLFHSNPVVTKTHSTNITESCPVNGIPDTSTSVRHTIKDDSVTLNDEFHQQTFTTVKTVPFESILSMIQKGITNVPSNIHSLASFYKSIPFSLRRNKLFHETLLLSPDSLSVCHCSDILLALNDYSTHSQTMNSNDNKDCFNHDTTSFHLDKFLDDDLVHYGNIEALDYIFIYIACCLNKIFSQRIVTLLTKAKQSYIDHHNYKVGDSVVAYLLWVVNLLLCRTNHSHLKCTESHLHLYRQLHLTNSQSKRVSDTSNEMIKDPKDTTKDSLPCNVLIERMNIIDSERHHTTRHETQINRNDEIESSHLNHNVLFSSILTECQQPITSLPVKSVQYPLSNTNPTVNDKRISSALLNDSDKQRKNYNVSSETPINSSTCVSSSIITHLRPHMSCHLTLINLPLFQLFSSIIKDPSTELLHTSEFLSALYFFLFHGPLGMSQTYAACILLEIPWIKDAAACSPIKHSLQHTLSQSIMVPLCVENMFHKTFADFNFNMSTTKQDTLLNDIGKSNKTVEDTMTTQVKQSELPDIHFIVPYYLLHQRLYSIRILLRFTESMGSTERDRLKTDEENFQKEDARVLSRHKTFSLHEECMQQFITCFNTYLKTSNSLVVASTIAKDFLTEMRIREESLRLGQRSLGHAVETMQNRLMQIHTQNEKLLDIRKRALKKEEKLQMARKTADGIFKELVDLSNELRRLRDRLQSAKRESQRHRERWIETEHLIAVAPERRKQLNAQLTAKKVLERSTEQKLQSVRQAITSIQVELSQTETEKKRIEFNIKQMIEAKKCISLWKHDFFSDNNLLKKKISVKTDDILKSRTPNRNSDELKIIHTEKSKSTLNTAALDNKSCLLKSLNNCLSDSVECYSSINTLLSDDRDPSLWLNELETLLDTAISEATSRLQIVGVTRNTNDMRQLHEKQQTLETDIRRRSEAIRRLESALEVESDARILLEKSGKMQMDVRMCDEEVENLGSTIEQLEHQVRETEIQLELSKQELRRVEADFSSISHSLSSGIEGSNDTRLRFSYSIIALEKQLTEFLDETTSTFEDRQFSYINLGLLRATLVKESNDRILLRSKINEMIHLLQDTDYILECMGQLNTSESTDFSDSL